MTRLAELGWSPFFSQQLNEPGAEAGSGVPARVIEEQKGFFKLAGEFGEIWAEPTGKLLHRAQQRADLPAVGDWVVAELRPGGDRAMISRVLARHTKFSRKAAGDAEAEQIVAANIDLAFIVSSLNLDLNPRRLERYLTVVRQSGAQPVVLLTKADLCADIEGRRREIETLAGGVPVHAVSVRTRFGLEELRSYFKPGITAVLIGSSGVGKSTLINELAGSALQEVQEVRGDDDKGRHTTTYRRLVVLPGQGMIIDTPGMRELHLWESEGQKALDDAFEDVEALTHLCKFANCTHQREPKCAVRDAVTSGKLEAARCESYLKLLHEIEAQAARKAAAAKQAETVKAKRANPDYKRKKKFDSEGS